VAVRVGRHVPEEDARLAHLVGFDEAGRSEDAVEGERRCELLALLEDDLVAALALAQLDERRVVTQDAADRLLDRGAHAHRDVTSWCAGACTLCS
jgi:hypothetical protein